jgi:tRNA-specific adenosine deaminase 1
MIPTAVQDKPNSSSGTGLTCVALATGMKCLPHDKLPLAKGNVLHDCHAEILAMRAFNRWLVDECANLTEEGGESLWVRRRSRGRQRRGADRPTGECDETDDGTVDESGQENEAERRPFELREDVRIHMYCSEAPCGDASMEVLARGMADGTPWDATTSASGSPSSRGEKTATENSPNEQRLQDTDSSTKTTNLLHGRAFFSLVGIVRRKPGRADAPPTMSKSCSDKLAMKQCTGLLSSLTALMVNPTANTYLSSFVLPARAVVRESIERAFGTGGRMSSMAIFSCGEFRFRPFEVSTTTRSFAWEKSEDAVASNLSAVAVLGGRIQHQEVLINGVLQGRKIFDPRGASSLSRRRMWESVLDVVLKAQLVNLESSPCADGQTYEQVKNQPRLLAKGQMKAEVREKALVGWSRNIGDDQWLLER